MQVTLIGKRVLYKLNLPEVPIGSYWISNKNNEAERKIVNIEGIDDNWQITSNNNIKIIDIKSIENINDNKAKKTKESVKILEKAILKEYKMYGVYIEDIEELLILYCLPIFEQFSCLQIKEKADIFIGKDVGNQIIYNNNDMVSKRHTHIFFYNGKWRIENLAPRFGTYINNKLVEKKETVLSNGDMIFIMGLKIVILGDLLFVNNPNGHVICTNEYFVPKDQKIDKMVENGENEENVELYSDSDYFAKVPRIINVIERQEIKIDPPPQRENQQDIPIILTLGSSLSMGAIMMVSIISAIDGRASGTSSTKQMVFSLVTAGAMLISMLLFPIITAKYNRRRKRKNEEKRQKRYLEYLDKKKEEIKEVTKNQKNIMYENYASTEECAKIIISRNPRLWERNIESPDFLTVRLGIGDVPLNVDIQYPEEKFSLEDDNLLEALNEMVNNFKIIKSAPIVTSLVNNIVTAVISRNSFNVKRFMQSLIVQLIAFHSYEDLKLVFLLKSETKSDWEYVKGLPHVWDDSKQIRFWTDDYNDMQEISKYLEEELKERERYAEVDYRAFTPYYLIITDDYRNVENLRIITEILKNRVNLGFSILCVTQDLLQLPNECKTFISAEDKEGVIFENEISVNTQRKITFDTSVILNYEKICQEISNIPIRYTTSGRHLLPNSYTFLEMYDAGRIEQLNILDRWNKNDSTLSLKAPIGVDPMGMKIFLDIHEKFHGPHGLIAGSTGSGKSEFIITYILSLAINYHPNDVSFVLIDYKGGGLAGAFKKGNFELPHLVGTITNIDTNGLQRSLISIQSELRRRQVIFNEARNMTDEGTIDIYKYQKLYRKGVVSTPVPHLLIICDEFAELKQQQPDFMDELMSVSRIGRSLGVHLILATQKPAGIVNDQIRSNSRFAICLKVQDKSDSNDVIKRPDAANLKREGQFFMQVGFDEYFVLGQSAWSGAPYFPSDIVERKADNSIDFVSNIGTTIAQADDTVEKVITDSGEQLTNIVKYLHELAKQKNISSKNLWLEEISETIYLEKIKSKYKFKNKENEINPIIGEYDDPYNQSQGIVGMQLSTYGNTIIYGNASSGKETLLSTMIYDVITTYNAKEAQLYILDFGTEALKIFKGAPQVGDIIFSGDEEKIERFFNMIQREIINRKNLLSDYNGDYSLYLKSSGNYMPMIIVVINAYETFAELYGAKYDDAFLSITREGVKCGIVFVTTVSSYNDMRYRLTQNFKQKIALQINKEDDYYNIFENVGKKRVPDTFGRGLIKLEGGEIYEFQTAKICIPEDYNVQIKEAIEKQKQINEINAPNIQVMPRKVTFDLLEQDVNSITSVPIGITKKSLKVYNYNFKTNYINIICSKNIEDAVQFTVNILIQLGELKDVETKIIDAERIIKTDKVNIMEEYMKFIYEVKNGSKKKEIICVIVGLDRFLNDNEEIRKSFYATLKEIESYERCSFIIVDNVMKMKNHEYDEWYKALVSRDNGIWVGNGIDNQYLINVSSERKELVNNCGKSYGYAVRQGIAEMIKLVEMKEDDDLDE